jgi:PAS domain S-box-containing protein
LRIGREIDDAEERELVVTVLSVAIGAIAASFVIWLALRNRGLARYLASERTRFASMVESTSFPVYQVDRSGCVEHVNPAGERLLGHASGEILGKPMHAIVHPHHAEDATPDETCPMHGLGLGGRRRSTVLDQFVRSDGSLVDVEITSSPIVLPHGAVAGAVVVLQDVTTRLRQEKMKDDFIGFASHELRSPLTTINGMAKWLARDMAQDRARFTEDEHEAIEALGQGADRMRGIVELFLDLTRIDAGRLEVEPQEVDFGRLLGDEVEALRRRSPQATVEVSVPAERIAGWSDPQRLRQVLVNLLDNAVKYGGSPVRVEAGIERADSSVVFRVRDNGRGIAEADRNRVFDRFYTGDGVKGKGLGIGLFVSREIASLLGGALTFDSAPPGTEFRLAVPLNVDSPRHSSNGSGQKPPESVTQGTRGGRSG